jgi:hypothetical protein
LSRFKHCRSAYSKDVGQEIHFDANQSLAASVRSDFALHQKSPTYCVVERKNFRVKKTNLSLNSCRAAARIGWRRTRRQPN